MEVGVKELLRKGMVPARSWRAHAVEMVPHRKFKSRKQMAAAAAKKRTTSFSFSWAHLTLKWKKSSLTKPPRPGQREFGWANGPHNKKTRG